VGSARRLSAGKLHSHHGPRIAKGKVVVGVAGAEFPVRGFFAAYDAKTGAFAWKDYTVPGDPSKPFESEAMRKASATWDKDAWKMGGGGTVWDGMAYDADLNLLYVGTGNAGPGPTRSANPTAATTSTPRPFSRSTPTMAS